MTARRSCRVPLDIWLDVRARCIRTLTFDISCQIDTDRPHIVP